VIRMKERVQDLVTGSHGQPVTRLARSLPSRDRETSIRRD
jgi:hypothetical protein